ncbi:unnamed protein product [Peronospora farinosa]|uniref:Histidyl tRNA synthetase-related domain-containing protein n=1 Tax=Peronospora farinosa TaxID=134698 RepID=A0ABN8C6M7_9STRA|nr:unnamed protein product [Peronospora farinosa]
MLFRMQIAMLLWGLGINARYLHPEPLHLEDLDDYCAQQNIQWMVIVQNHMMREKQQVKIQAVNNHSDADVLVVAVDMIMLEESMNSSTNGGDGNNSSSTGNTLQPIFDVRVVDAKYQSRDRNYRNYQLDTQKVTRRVSKWISSSFSARADDAMKVLSIDLPFALVREMSSALMEAGHDGIDTMCANNPRYRKQLKYTMEEILTLMPESTSRRGGRERYVLLHSMVDDRYDMMSLNSSSTSHCKKY